MSTYFSFSENEMAYLKSVNEEYDQRLSPYAAKNNSAIRRRTPRYDMIRPQYSYKERVISENLPSGIKNWILESSYMNRWGIGRKEDVTNG